MPGAMEVHNMRNSWEERVTGSPKFIDTDHAYVHEGYAFDAFVVTTGEGVIWTRFKTPAATSARPYIHFRPTAINVDAGSIRFQVYDTNTSGLFQAGSTSSLSNFHPVNRKYSSATTSAVTFITGATATSTAAYTLKYDRITYGATGPAQTRIGASKGEALEWIFEPDTEYGFCLTGASISTQMCANFFWYEEETA